MAQLDLGVGPDAAARSGHCGALLRVCSSSMPGRITSPMWASGHGTGEGDFLLVPPDWSGTAPSDATVIRVPTRVASIVGRWACTGEDDLARVHALQDASTSSRLDPGRSPTGCPTRERTVGRAGVPGEAAGVVAGVPARHRAISPYKAPRRRPGSPKRDPRRTDRRFGPVAGLTARRRRRRRTLKKILATRWQQPGSERLAADHARIRLQPGLLRSGCSRRPAIQDHRPRGPHRRTCRRREGRPVGQPPTKPCTS